MTPHFKFAMALLFVVVLVLVLSACGEYFEEDTNPVPYAAEAADMCRSFGGLASMYANHRTWRAHPEKNELILRVTCNDGTTMQRYRKEK